MNVETYVVVGDLINEIRRSMNIIDHNRSRVDGALQELNSILKENGQQEVALDDIVREERTGRRRSRRCYPDEF